MAGRRLAVVGVTIGAVLIGAATVQSSLAATDAATAPAVTTSSAATAAATEAAQAAEAARHPSQLTWGVCDSAGLQAAGAVCGTLTVPLDYANPRGDKVHLALSMIKHSTPDAQYQGIMITNPGGPGGSGLTLSVLGSYVPNGAGDSYDWIGFDPRGVGASTPSLSCLPDYFSAPRPDYVPRTRALANVWLARSKAYATACGVNGGALLSHLTTVDTVRDMDSIRAALRQRQINYYGFSYGTYLGQVYGTLFPNRVRRMVLDSNVDPTRVWYQANLDQDYAFERNVKIWFAWVAKYDSVYHLGTTEKAVERLWYAQQAKLSKTPAGGVVGGDEWNDIFLYAGYYQQTWIDLANTFAGWVNDGDSATLIAEYQSADGPGDDNGFAMYNAVQCTDTQWPARWSTWRRDNWKVYSKAPFETWGNAWYNAPCLFWPAKAHTPVTVDGAHVAGALLIDETLDAATPYSGSLEVRKLFPKSSLIALPGGTSHANSLYGDSCLDDQIAAYIADGTLPARKPGNGPDAVCAPLPVPDPTAVAVSASAKVAAGGSNAIPRARLVPVGRL